MYKSVKISKSLLCLFLLLSTEIRAQETTGIPFESVSEALQHLQESPSYSIQEMDGGWIVATGEDQGLYELWTFTPSGHNAHPAVIKRTIIEEDGAIYVRMNVLCGGPKQDCDILVGEFEELNNSIRESMVNGI